MKEVLIDGEIGYDWWSDSGTTAKDVKRQLEGIEDGEDIKININSPGGSIYEGIVIFNLIRDYAKTHPVSVRINCIAMSMGGYIALAARTVNKDSKIIVCENSVFMIHNPWMYTWGDHHQLEKDADYLEKLTALYASVHSAVSGKPEKEIRAAMDEETFYVGKEIQDMGFANDWEEITEANNEKSTMGRSHIIISAKFAMNRIVEKTREAKSKNETAYRGDLQKAVALCCVIPKDAAQKNESKKTNAIGGFMRPEELLAQDKSCYDAVLALGEKAALEKERARIAAHIKRGEKIGALDIALKHIQGGASVTDEAVNEEYFEAALDKKRIEARNADNPPPVNTGGDDGKSDDEKLAAAFDNGLKGRDAGGKSWAE
jgi:ATP-dependent protease ClpP protease subunit